MTCTSIAPGDGIPEVIQPQSWDPLEILEIDIDIRKVNQCEGWSTKHRRRCINSVPWDKLDNREKVRLDLKATTPNSSESRRLIEKLAMKSVCIAHENPSAQDKLVLDWSRRMQKKCPPSPRKPRISKLGASSTAGLSIAGQQDISASCSKDKQAARKSDGKLDSTPDTLQSRTPTTSQPSSAPNTDTTDHVLANPPEETSSTSSRSIVVKTILFLKDILSLLAPSR